MDPLAPIFVIVPAAVIYLSYRKRRRWRKVLATLASERGWDLNKGGLFASAELIGFDGIRTITIQTESRGQNSIATVITIKSPLNHISAVGKEGFTSGLKKMVQGEDYQLGIPELDTKWLLRGQPRALLARLGRRAWPVIDGLIDKGGRVGDDGVYLSKMGYLTDYDELVAYVDAALEASHILDPESPDDDQLLLENVSTGATAENRRLCFEAIVSQEVGAQAATLMLEDPAPQNRVMGAVMLERADVIVALLADKSALDLATQLEAVSALSRFDMEAARAILADLGTYHDAGFDGVLELAARLDLLLPLENLTKMAEYGDLAVRRVLSPVLALHGPVAEPTLLTLLADADDAVAVGAANALKAVGTLAAVHPMMRRSEGILRGGDLKKAARDAIATIQVRHGGSERGGLALAESDVGGGLAVVDDGDDSAP